MKKVTLCIILIFMNLLIGCFDYEDINKVVFGTALILDIDEDNTPIVYIEGFHSYRSKQNNAERGQRLILKSKGKTIFQAIRNLNKTTSYKVNMEQNEVIIFTEKAAKHGLQDFLDVFISGEEFVLRQHVLIYEGDVEQLLKEEFREEEYLGLYLRQLLENEIVDKFYQKVRLFEFMNRREANDKTQVVSLLELNQVSLQPKLIIHQGGIIKGDHMVDKLQSGEEQFYNYLMDELSLKVLIIPNPQNKEKFIGLEILGHKTKTNIQYDGEKITLIKKIYFETNFVESQSGILLRNDEERNKISEIAQQYVKRKCKELFKKYQQKKIDIFHIKEAMKREYPKVSTDEILYTADLKMEVQIEIKKRSKIENFK